MSRSISRLIIMLGPGMDYPGGMTEVVRRYSAAGVFAAWPMRYISTYAGRGLSTMLRTWLRALCSVLSLLIRGRVALLHVHSAAYGSFWRKSVLCALAMAFRVPYVIHLHDGRMSTFYGRDCSRLAKSWVRAVLRRAARVIVLSAHWRDVVRQIEPAARTTVIGNPVAVPMRLAPLRQPARTVLFLAWLQKDKGLFDLIAAMPFVLRHVPEARFVLAGSGNIDAVVQLARALGVEHTLLLPGWVNGNEKDDLLGQSDVFALPSYYEGLPVGVLEAMARGVPVVTTPVGGVPDVIKDGVNGLLVEPGQPKALARAIVALLTDDGLRQRLREAAHRQVGAKYSSEKVVDAIGALYRDLGIGVETVKRQAASYT